MAKKKDEKPAEAAPAPITGPGPMLQVLAQYTKDQSFENPNAPESLRNDKGQPQINIQIEIGRQMLADDTVEVTLILKADARREDQVAFIAELEYAGLFAFQNMNLEQVQPMMMIECPRMIFPFLRRIISDVTRDGGFPPLNLDNIDFMQLYRNEIARRQGEAAAQPQN